MGAKTRVPRNLRVGVRPGSKVREKRPAGKNIFDKEMGDLGRERVERVKVVRVQRKKKNRKGQKQKKAKSVSLDEV